MTRIFLVLALCCVSTTALSAGWGASVTIAGYYIWDGGHAHVKTSQNQNPDGCSSPAYLTIDPNVPNFKYIWAQVMTAHAIGQTVTVYYNGCIGPYPLISAIAIPNIW